MIDECEILTTGGGVMPSNPLIGIVVPIYNVESYLKECLDSILNQTYQHFVVALINDGSTDSSLNIALEYVRKDKRFILFDKTNAGLSSARNVGIDYFSGKYNFAKKDSDFIITNDNPYNISRVYGECVLDSKDSLLDSKETQYYKESQKDSSDLRLSDDESVSNANKGRHNEDSSRHSLRSEREESLLHEETKSDMLNLTTQGQKTTKVLREELKEKLQPIINQDITNKATGLTGRITTNERDKIGSDKAIIKSIKNGFSKEEHFKAGENIEELFINAKLRGIYEDYKKGKK